MYDQSKFSKFTKCLGAQNHSLIRDITLYLLEVLKMKRSISKTTSYIFGCNIPSQNFISTIKVDFSKTILFFPSITGTYKQHDK